MPSKKQQPVDTIFDIPIYFDKFSETFYAEVDGRTIRRDSLKRLRQDLDSDRVFDINIPLIKVDLVLGDMERVTATKIDSSNQIHLNRGNNYNSGNLAPTTGSNLAIYNQYVKLKRQGWALIEQAGQLTKQMDLLPKDYWIKKVKELRKAEPPKTQEGIDVKD